MASFDPLPPLIQAGSGAIGSAIGNAIVFPLDLATTRLQHAQTTPNPNPNARKVSLLRTLHRLTRRKGFIQLYSGLGADTLSTILSSFLYFYFYTSLTKAVIRSHRRTQVTAYDTNKINPAGLGSSKGKAAMNKPLSAVEELLVGLIAGVASKGITLPVSAVKVRQQLSSEEDGESKSVLSTIKQMHKEGGFLGLFAALPPSIPLALLPSLTLYIHTLLLKLTLPSRLRSHPPGSVTFLLGAISNALATIPLYPLVLIKALSQSGVGRESSKGKAGMIETMQGILETEGVIGLYKGIEGQLLKGLVSQGVMMLVKQRVEELVVKMYRARRARS